MAKLFLLSAFVLAASACSAQEENPLPVDHQEVLFDTAPRFPGGPGSMLKYFSENVQYPEPERSKSIEGNVYLKFNVTEKGNIINAEVTNGVPGGPNLAKEARRLVENMPLWIPAVKDGKPVQAEYHLSVPFKIKNEIFRPEKSAGIPGLPETAELIFLRSKVVNANNDTERLMSNDSFVIALEKVLQKEESFRMDFDSLKQTGILLSPDHAFRMITWNLPFDDETHKYYCYIQVPARKKKKYAVYKLTDKSDQISSPQRKSLDKNNWFGALYYEIIPFPVNGKMYYTLLGWDGNNSLTRKKIIDVLYFASNGEPKFGDDIFFKGKIPAKRVIFEYAAQAAMSLRYHPERNQIVFDHLSPSQPEMEGMFQYYGPDFSYDAFEWEKGKWVYKEDVDVRLDSENPLYNPELKSKEKPVYSPK
jgi:TonB family protein